jgi:hypothetical protein
MERIPCPGADNRGPMGRQHRLRRIDKGTVVTVWPARRSSTSRSRCCWASRTCAKSQAYNPAHGETRLRSSLIGKEERDGAPEA